MTRVGGPLIDISGMSEWEARQEFKKARHIKLAKGIYVRESDWARLDITKRAKAQIVASVVATPKTVAAGQSAAILHGLPLVGQLDHHAVELGGFRATKGGRRRYDHVYRHLSKGQVAAAEKVQTPFGRVLVTTPAATGLDLARWHQLSLGVRCLDSALAQKLMVPADMDAPLKLAAGCVGIEDMRNATRLASPWSESPRESDMKVAMWKAGLPPPLQQVNLYDAYGKFVARLDFFWPDIGFGTEYDGGGKFAGEYGVPVVIAAREDVERQHRISNLGVNNFRVNHRTARTGAAMRNLAAAYRRVAERGVPLDPALWRCVGGPAWSTSRFPRG
ncbi:MAG: hypothetical protein Q4G50_05060 [Corynebacterium sp.]|uniref:type IV toxin-antitoxin system AbiEi family antitoxin n=1 Tax=Corynebacterium sp. TaxID=1720 RepID=UPI0026DF8123|nr:hypothetical protein [Corynebacterium sp.]MDO5669351.1 hypothetical protein [Corynebacterium sp.]